jgi:hypothetical protein
MLVSLQNDGPVTLILDAPAAAGGGPGVRPGGQRAATNA